MTPRGAREPEPKPNHVVTHHLQLFYYAPLFYKVVVERMNDERVDETKRRRDLWVKELISDGARYNSVKLSVKTATNVMARNVRSSQSRRLYLPFCTPLVRLIVSV